MNAKIDVITYEQDRLNYFTDQMEKAQKRYSRLLKKCREAPMLSAESQMLSDVGREAQFHRDVVEMLEKGVGKHSDGLANDIANICPDLVENGCGGFSCVDCLTRGLEHKGYSKQSEGVTDNNVGHKSEWISVEDRLPEKDVRVLVWLTEGASSYTRIDTDRRTDTELYGERWARWFNNVTHWMPLPEAPKGGEE